MRVRPPIRSRIERRTIARQRRGVATQQGSNTDEIDFHGLVWLSNGRQHSRLSKGSQEGASKWTRPRGAGPNSREWQNGGCRNGSLNFSNN